MTFINILSRLSGAIQSIASPSLWPLPEHRSQTKFAIESKLSVNSFLFDGNYMFYKEQSYCIYLTFVMQGVKI